MNAGSVMVDESIFDLFDFDLDFDNVSTYDSVGTTEESTGISLSDRLLRVYSNTDYYVYTCHRFWLWRREDGQFR